MREIHPLGLVPYAIIMNALAYQVSILSLFQLLKKKSMFQLNVAGRPSKCRPRKAVTKL